MILEGLILKIRVQVSLRKIVGEIYYQNAIKMHQKLPNDCPKKNRTNFLRRLNKNIE